MHDIAEDEGDLSQRTEEQSSSLEETAASKSMEGQANNLAVLVSQFSISSGLTT